MAAAAATTPATAAAQSTITFETARLGNDFTGPVTEAGFTYARSSGTLFVNDRGHPGENMSGSESGGGGVLDIRQAAGLAFLYNGLDFSAFDASGQGSQTLTVTGLFGGATVGTATYTLTNTSTFNPTFANWTTFGAGTLGGVTLDELRIALNAGLSPGIFSENIDNVRLTATTAPEPATWVLAAGGLGLTGLSGMNGAARRRARTTAA